ncbi:MAG: cupin domain-containing protein [Chloroflexota bacterium]
MTTAAAPIEITGMTIQFLLDGEATGHSISVFRCDFEAGARIPIPHSHDGFDETIYGLSGTFTMVVDGVPHHVGPGEVLHIPRGVVHGFAVREAASILVASTPGVFGQAYFREMAHALDAAGDGPPDRELLAAIMRRHGLTPAPPA